MAFKQRTVVNMEHPLAGEFIKESALPVFSEIELERFGESLEDFMEEREFPARGSHEATTGRVLNFQEAAVAYGALKKTEYLGKPMYSVRLKAIDFDDYGNPIAYQNPSMYERFCDKLAQYTSMMSRRNFIEAKKIEGLEELAASYGVDHTPGEIELGAGV